MAYVATSIVRTVFGNKRAVGFNMTADAASGAVDTGLSVIEGFLGAVPVSAATAAPKFKVNLNSGTTANNGSLFVSSCTAGDVFFVTVFGR